MDDLFQNPRLLTARIRSKLRRQEDGFRPPDDQKEQERKSAAILFLMGMHSPDPDGPAEACLIFNQRSRHVRQPGDLCFPGGGLEPYLDRVLAGILYIPGLPLYRWNARDQWNRSGPKTPRGIPRLLATGLREGFEEMRINPFRIRFLGPMTPEYFQRFDRTVYPMVAWHAGPDAFVPNWEVERIVHIPLRRFFDPGAYGRVPLSHLSRFDDRRDDTPPVEMFPCLTYENGGDRELLWGLTFRIVMRFLHVVFDFTPPETASLPVVPKPKGVS